MGERALVRNGFSVESEMAFNEIEHQSIFINENQKVKQLSIKI
jgi:hypothetical protein